jgi:hypothetical protein
MNNASDVNSSQCLGNMLSNGQSSFAMAIDQIFLSYLQVVTIQVLHDQEQCSIMKMSEIEYIYQAWVSYVIDSASFIEKSLFFLFVVYVKLSDKNFMAASFPIF